MCRRGLFYALYLSYTKITIYLTIECDFIIQCGKNGSNALLFFQIWNPHYTIFDFIGSSEAYPSLHIQWFTQFIFL